MPGIKTQPETQVRQKPARATRKPSKAALAKSRADKAKRLSKKKLDLAARREEFKQWINCDMPANFSTDVAGRLFAAALREARVFLEPKALMMALVAIGMLEESRNEFTTGILIGNILYNTAENTLPVDQPEEP